MSKITLGYWDYHGFGLPIRIILEVAGADYEEKLYFPEKKNEWLKEKKNLDVLFPNIPYIIDGELKFTEHLVIMRYLGKKFDLGPKNEKERILLEQIEFHVCDISEKFYETVYDVTSYEKSKKEFIILIIHKLNDLEKFFESKNFIFRDRLTYVDIYLYANLVLLNAFDEQILQNKPNLRKFIKHMDEFPEIKAYKNSSRWKTRKVCNSFSLFKGTY